MLPTIDVSNLPTDGICYTFYNDNIVVYFADSSSKTYKLVNDKVYLSNTDDIAIYNSDTCLSYVDIANVPHSLSGLAPFYCTLCVLIFFFLVWAPYKIFLKPLMPRI